MLRRLIALAAVVIGTALSFTNLHGQPQPQPGVLHPRLLEQAEARDQVLAIVTVRGDNVPSPDAPLELLHAAVADATGPVLARHQLTNNVLGRLTSRPRFRVAVSRDQLLALAADPDVVSIQPETIHRPSRLATSVPFIGAHVAHDGGLTGADWTIVIIDTGVSSSHPFLLNKTGIVLPSGIRAEGCIGTNFPLPGGGPPEIQSMCPDGNDVDTLPDEQNFSAGSGGPCPELALGCDHGTHVAGIAAGNSGSPTGLKGVAPDAKIFPLQIFSRFLRDEDCNGAAPCIGAFGMDIEQAVDRIFNIRASFRVIEPGGREPWDAATKLVVNYSLAGDTLFGEDCGESGSNVGALLAANDNRIPEIVSAGQSDTGDGSPNSLPFPACQPGVISVGAIQHTANNLWQPGHRASFLDLLAPGVGINSPGLPAGTSPGGFFSALTGTSASAAHVAGAVTLIRQHAPNVSVANIMKTIKKAGDQVIEGTNTFRTLRLDRTLQIPFASDILTNTLVQTDEDTTLRVPLTLSDLDTPLDNLIVTVTSSDTSLVPNDPAFISVTGSGADRVINLTPALNKFGTTNITYSVSDGTHTAETNPFTMTVVQRNDAPTIDVSPSSSITVPINTAATLTVIVGDGDSPPSTLNLTASSLNQSLLPKSNITIQPISTTAFSRTFTVTMTPVNGQQGSSTVTLTARDASVGGLSTTHQIIFTAGTANATPTIPLIDAQTTPEGTPLNVPFTVEDADSPLDSLILTASSATQTIVAQSGMVFSGTGANRVLRITPVANASGGTFITVNVSDGNTIGGRVFALNVTNVSSAPVITGPTSATTTPSTAVVLSMTVTDTDSTGASLAMTAASSNTLLLPNSGITISPTTTGPNSRGFNVTMTPAGGSVGSATVTLTATDESNTQGTANISLVVALTNEAPLISYIADQTTAPNTEIGPIPFTISDAETPAGSLVVSGASSNQGLLPNANIVFGGSGGLRTVTLTPAAGQLGSSLVTIRVSDGQQQSLMRFTLTVVGPPPGTPESISATVNGNLVSVSWTRPLGGSAPSNYLLEIGTAPGASSLPTQSTGNANTSLLLTLPDGTFYFRVRSVNSAGVSGVSPETSAVVGNAALIPGPPSNFAVTTVGAGAVFTWSPPAVGAAVATYIIEAGSGPGASNLAVVPTGSAATSFHLPVVPPGTYFVRVRGANIAGIGAPTQDVAFTMGGVSCTTAPGAPVLLTPVVAGSTVTLSWIGPPAGDPPSSYVVMAGSASGVNNIATFDTLSASTSFAAPVPNGTFFVRVASRNPCGDSAPSNEMSFTVGTVAPGAPSLLTASVGGGGSVTLNWVAPSTGGAPTGYVIQGGSAPGLSNLANVPTGSTATTFSAVAPSGTYFVRVRAVNAGGLGGASNEITVVVP